MQRRKVIAGLGTGISLGIAGCTSSGSGLDGNLDTQISEITLSDVKTKTEEGSSGEALTLRATLENTGTDTYELIAEGSFYDSNNAELKTSLVGGFASDEIDLEPGDKKSKMIAATPANGEPAKYDITLVQEGASTGSTPSATDSQTADTPEETDSPTPEPIDASFTDNWEDGNYMQNPVWKTDFTFTSNSKDHASLDVVKESAPEGGSHSLSLFTSHGSYPKALTKPKFRWDAPWIVEGLLKMSGSLDHCDNRIALASDTFNFEEYNIDLHWELYDGEGSVSIKGELIEHEGQGISKTWETDVWYHYKCHHDGNGQYRLKVWNDENTEPSYQTQATGKPPQTNENTKKGIGLLTYSWDKEFNVNHAYISYETE